MRLKKQEELKKGREGAKVRGYEDARMRGRANARLTYSRMPYYHNISKVAFTLAVETLHMLSTRVWVA